MINGLKQFTAAALIALSSSAFAGAVMASNSEFEGYSNIIAVNTPGIRNSTDSSIDQAVDYLSKADHAVEIKHRRNKTKPAFDSRVVKHRLPSNADKILILGGSDIVPM
ncbi:hypothetical protein BH11CYA1_BH11CYA1_09690 [soil metagenome]